MRRVLMIVLPILVLAVGAYGALIMIKARPESEQLPQQVMLPLVQVMKVEPETRQLAVHAQGTVAPKTASQLASEVSGRVIWVSPALVVGGFFSKGQVLLKVDRREYELGVIRARATVARAKLRLATEEQEANLAKEEWESLGRGAPTPLVLREPQIKEAAASLAAAEATFEQAEYDLERTEVKAPYSGRVRSKEVDVGQFVSRGSSLARLYSVDFAEVRLPIPDSELAYLNLPLDSRGQSLSTPGPRVILNSEFAGKNHRWIGYIVRTEGEIDARTRMVHAIAQVKDPYGQGSDLNRPPLAVGMFVEAEIQGKWVKDVFMVPRSVLRGEQVLVVDGRNRLYYRKVKILRAEQDHVLITSGLKAGEQICLSVLEIPVNGMRVTPVESSIE